MNRAENDVIRVRELMAPANPVPPSAFTDSWEDQPAQESFRRIRGDALLLTAGGRPRPRPAGSRRWLLPAAAAVAVVAVAIGAAAVGSPGHAGRAPRGLAGPTAGSGGGEPGAVSRRAVVTVGSLPYGVAVDPSAGVVYVVNTFGPARSNGAHGSVSVISDRTDKVTGTTVSVINGATNQVTATITIGRQPQGVAVDPRTGTIYVAQFRGDSVTVIDGQTLAVTATIPVGRGPQQIAFDARRGTVYVANMNDNTVSVLSS